MAAVASFLGIEDAGRTRVLAHQRGDDRLLDHGAIGGQVAEEDCQPAGGRMGGIEGSDDRAVRHGGRHQALGQGAAGHGQDIAVQQAAVQQPAHHRRDATGAVQVFDMVAFRRRAHPAQVRGTRAVPVHFAQGDLDAGFVGHRQQVQY